MTRAFVTIMVVLLALPAYAEPQKLSLPQIGSKAESPEEKERRLAVEKAYLDKLKTIPDKPAPADPWKKVR
jgi:hypothetical protein